MEEYKTRVRKVKSLLSGKTVTLEKELKREMQGASSALNFELAAEIRDSLAAIGKLNVEQRIIDFDRESRDYMGSAHSGKTHPGP